MTTQLIEEIMKEFEIKYLETNKHFHHLPYATRDNLRLSLERVAREARIEALEAVEVAIGEFGKEMTVEEIRKSLVDIITFGKSL